MWLLTDIQYVRFGKNKDDEDKIIDPRDMLVGAGEGALGGLAATNLERNVLHAPKGTKLSTRLKAAGSDIKKSFRKENLGKTGKEAALAAGIGAVTTGIVGAGLNIASKPFRKQKYTTGNEE